MPRGFVCAFFSTSFGGLRFVVYFCGGLFLVLFAYMLLSSTPWPMPQPPLF